MYTFEINPEITKEVERTQLELEGYRGLYNSMLASTYTIPEDKQLRLEKLCIKAAADYEKAKDAVNKLIPEEYQNENYSWTLDFDTNSVTINAN